MSHPSISWRIREFFDGRVLTLTAFAVLASISVFCFVQGNRVAARQTQSLALTQASAATPVRSKYVAKPIRDAKLLDWVLAENPELADADLDEQTIEPSQWRCLHLQMEKPGGDRLDIGLVRPSAWVQQHGAVIGATIELQIDEMHVQGPAYVQFVGPCPALQPRPSPRHQLITGTFVRSAANIIELHVKGLADPIRCTANHPFWSEDRKEFVQAGSLQPDERLLTAHGESRCVEQVIACETSVPVYNIEVQNQHTYFVSNLGLLAHNAGMVYGKGAGRLHGPILSADDVRFSQRTVHGATATSYAQKMRTGRWNWARSDSGPLTVMEVRGNLLSYDNRRLYAARVSGQNVPIKRVLPSDAYPGKRFKTWGDAFTARLKENGLPSKGTSDLPELLW